MNTALSPQHAHFQVANVKTRKTGILSLSFVQCSETGFSKDSWESCTTVLFFMLANHRTGSNNRSHVPWAVSLVIANRFLKNNRPWGFM